MVSRVFKSLGVLVIAFISAFIITFLFASIFEDLINYLPLGQRFPFLLWGILTIVFAALGLRLQTGKGYSSKSEWGSPTEIRAEIINQPQFVGRLDREQGMLETTARMVSIDSVNQPSIWNQNGEEYTIFRFRGELLDQNGSLLEYIPVEVKAKRRDWVGELAQGDRIRVEGKIEKDGILHAERLFNYSTNSWVGNNKN